jgi:gentisate 1,2-dioxygenase
MNTETVISEDRRREDFYQRISGRDMTPLWEVLHTIVPKHPASRCVPASWRYDAVRPLVMESGRIISAEKAERRVLILENPACRGESRATNTLYAGLQLLLPEEVAPSHRHTQSAIRFVVEGEGAYTAVDGERAYMNPGDLILTPPWTWHDHGNESDAHVIWLDCLDIPLVQYLDGGFAEPLGEKMHQTSRAPGDSLLRYGANLLPVEFTSRPGVSPVFTYPYDRTREALEGLSKNGPIDPSHGVRMKYVNPATGDYAMPTIAPFVQLLPKGFHGETYRSTDSMVFIVVEGRGETRIAEQTYAWEPHDIFVIPSWIPYAHHIYSEDAVLFSCSDRVVQEKLGLWREQRHEQIGAVGK